MLCKEYARWCAGDCLRDRCRSRDVISGGDSATVVVAKLADNQALKVARSPLCGGTHFGIAPTCPDTMPTRSAADSAICRSGCAAGRYGRSPCEAGEVIPFPTKVHHDQPV
jgi:hypothetical protein